MTSENEDYSLASQEAYMRGVLESLEPDHALFLLASTYHQAVLRLMNQEEKISIVGETHFEETKRGEILKTLSSDSFSDILTYTRVLKGQIQKEAAKESGVSIGQYSRIEHGYPRMTDVNLFPQLAGYIDLPEESIISIVAESDRQREELIRTMSFNPFVYRMRTANSQSRDGIVTAHKTYATRAHFSYQEQNMTTNIALAPGNTTHFRPSFTRFIYEQINSSDLKILGQVASVPHRLLIDAYKGRTLSVKPNLNPNPSNSTT